MGVGRETTARHLDESQRALAYTMGVGRETTAVLMATSTSREAYTMGVGRETTAWNVDQWDGALAYTMGVGRETTAALASPPIEYPPPTSSLPPPLASTSHAARPAATLRTCWVAGMRCRAPGHDELFLIGRMHWHA